MSHSPYDPERASRMAADPELRELSHDVFLRSCEYRYSYNFSWLGRPIIQYPQDMIALQEIIWKVQPDLIVETGIAHGGSLVFSASLLEMLGNAGQVVGVDIEIRKHNREAIEQHPMSKRITLVEGSSIDPGIVAQVQKFVDQARKVLVILDSNHTHEHVLRELQLYSPMVSENSYLIVFDTVVEDMPGDAFTDRPWGPGNNPKTAVRQFLKQNGDFVPDRDVENKLLLTVAPEGYLRRVRKAA